MCSSHSSSVTSAGYRQHKVVWIWTESKQVMTAAVERGWNTFIFPPDHRELATEWSSIALIHPLFIKEEKLFDSEGRGVATVYDVTSPQQLQLLQPEDKQADNVIINLLDWQVIPAENIVAAFKGSHITVFAISKSPSEAQIFLELPTYSLVGVLAYMAHGFQSQKVHTYFFDIS
ncbi:uncharacterized protein LOC117930757 isoform X3 [Vitis riparia]|nr:uncharacterized protein LOC117930757 isoform X3 [Vitis riparia]